MENAAHEAARERAERAETQVSMTKLDLKSSRDEVARLQYEVAGLQQKVRVRKVYIDGGREVGHVERSGSM